MPIEKVIGSSYSEFYSEDDTKDFIGKAEKVFETGKSLQYEYISQRDGRYFLRTLSPVMGPDGSIKSIIMVSKDISERKQAEGELRQANEELSREHNQRKML